MAYGQTKLQPAKLNEAPKLNGDKSEVPEKRDPKVRTTTSVVQVLDEGLLCGSSSPYLLKNVPKNVAKAEGDTFSCWVQKTNKVFSYIDVAGASRTVNIYVYVGKWSGK